MVVGGWLVVEAEDVVVPSSVVLDTRRFMLRKLTYASRRHRSPTMQASTSVMMMMKIIMMEWGMARMGLGV